MPQNKSHHFVPQFLLRRFSSNDCSIGLCNVRSGKIVTGASIKHQACRNWFYGRNGKAEHSLAEIEGAASAVLRQIIDTGRPPKRYSDNHRMLANFVVIQAARTAQAAAEATEMLSKLGKLMLRNTLTDPELLAALDGLVIEPTEPAANALRPVLSAIPVILDLKIKLLHNVSSVPFVLGDHPAIKHNGLYSEAKVSVLGLASLGLQLVVPISPDYMIVFYDENAYSLGNSISNIVKLRSANIVTALNEFQWANASDNVYFRPGGDPVSWVPSRERLAELRRDEHVSVDEGDVQIVDGTRAKVIRVQTQRPSRALKMPMFRNMITPPPLLSLEALPLRDLKWAFHVRQMNAAFEAGTISREELHFRTLPPPFQKQALREWTIRDGAKPS